MKTIPLTNGKNMIIDKQDYDWASLHKWTCSNGYPYTSWKVLNKYGMSVTIPTSFHRIITNMVTNSDNDLHVDHINRNKLDNRRVNLRIVSRSENFKNSKRQDKSKKPYYIVKLRQRRNGKVYLYHRLYIREGNKMVLKRTLKSLDDLLTELKIYYKI